MAMATMARKLLVIAVGLLLLGVAAGQELTLLSDTPGRKLFSAGRKEGRSMLHRPTPGGRPPPPRNPHRGVVASPPPVR